MSGQTAYFSAIDAMRGVAAICVVIFHYTRFYMPHAGVAEIPVAVADVPYAEMFGILYLRGEDFVRLFWVISGFVFAHVYWNRTVTLRTFAVARVARLYPLHIATLFFVAVVQAISLWWAGHWQIVGHNDLKHFMLQLFLLDASLTLSDGNSFNAPIWSVSAEVLVYLIFFVTLPFSRTFGLLGCLVLMLTSYVILALRPAHFILADWVFICGVFFFAGASCYAFYQLCADRIAMLWAGIAICLGGAIFGGFAGFADVRLLASCCTAVLILAFVQRWPMAHLPVLRFLGDISYSLYLVHVPLQICVLLVADVAFGGTRAFAGTAITLPVYLLVSIGLAHVVHKRFERPAGAWLRARWTNA